MSKEVSTVPANRLAKEKSPYLLQHAHNPVDWFPWGEEAFQVARERQVPILLSIGYSTCHWCHVMERESFTDPATGAFLNANFVSIKVDREERPDVDKIYMTFVQSLSGGGGWPLNVFLTPDLKPFYGGTYFPPEPRHGRPSFLAVLEQVKTLWTERRDELVESAAEMTERLKAMLNHSGTSGFPIGIRELHGAGQAMLSEFDPVNGGFGGAPKFPRPCQPAYLLRYAKRFADGGARQAVLITCDHMAAGGMYDQLGGGFSRYSVDERWLVPHFEKMLYDNAQLLHLYLDAWLVGRQPRHAEVSREILTYVTRDMTHPEGGFYSAEDADSEGHEGKFYCWTLDEIRTVLPPDEAAVVIRHFGITEKGNFSDHSHPQPLTGQNILSRVDRNLSSEEGRLVESACIRLLEIRGRRIRPHLDDKVLASWNGMMMGAAARAYGILGDPRHLHLARQNWKFLKTHLWDGEVGTLYHRWRDGSRDSVEILDAHAHVASGLTDLYEATLDPSLLEDAVAITDSMIRRFYDAETGGFWQTPSDTPHLLMRIKDDYDGAEPAGNSVATLVLLRLAALCGREDWKDAALKTLGLFSQRLHQLPQAVPLLLSALDMAQQEPKRVVISGDPVCEATRNLISAAHSVYEPNRVVSGTTGPVDEFSKSLPVPAVGEALAYCCTGTACQPPTTDPDTIRKFLEQAVVPM